MSQPLVIKNTTFSLDNYTACMIKYNIIAEPTTIGVTSESTIQPLVSELVTQIFSNVSGITTIINDVSNVINQKMLQFLDILDLISIIDNLIPNIIQVVNDTFHTTIITYAVRNLLIYILSVIPSAGVIFDELLVVLKSETLIKSIINKVQAFINTEQTKCKSCC